MNTQTNVGIDYLSCKKKFQTTYEDAPCPGRWSITSHCLVRGLCIVNYLQRENLEMGEKEKPEKHDLSQVMKLNVNSDKPC